MTGAERRTLAAAGTAGALLAGAAAVLYGLCQRPRPVGYFAYEPLSGAVYRSYSFGGTVYFGWGDLALAGLRGLAVGAVVGLALGLTVGAIVTARGTARSFTRRRLAVAALTGAALGAGLAVLLHFRQSVFTIGPVARRVADYSPASFAHPPWWPSALVTPVLGALCGLALGLLTGNEKRSITTTG